MLTQELLKLLIHYCPFTGVFTWKERPRSTFKTDIDMRKWNGKWAGRPAGCATGSVVDVHVFRKNWRGHRLAFLYMTGSIPDLVDHIDGDPLNNSFANLRSATRGQNRANSIPALGRKIKGAYITKEGSHVAKIRHNGVTHHLGTFATAMEAGLAYDHAATQIHGEFAKTNVGMGLL